MTRGGPRTGAGRPKGTTTSRARPVMIRLAPADLAAVDAALDPGETRSQFFAAAAAAAVDARRKALEDDLKIKTKSAMAWGYE